jgi:hypothetical protein
MDKKRVKESKTQTIKQRAIYVYLPSHRMVTKWKESAEKQGVSISKFVIEHVENSLRQEEGEESYITKVELLKDFKKLKEENIELRKRNKIMDTVVSRLDEELRSYRSKPFIEKDFTGIRQYEEDLIKLFKEKKEIRKEDFLDFLSIKPSDKTAIKWIYAQIETLEQYGLLKDLGGKWRWKG